MTLYINLPLIFDIEIHAQSVMNLAYGSYLVHEIIASSLIIIKKGRQCKAKREWYTPYQSEDPRHTIPTYRQKEKKGKKSRRL